MSTFTLGTHIEKINICGQDVFDIIVKNDACTLHSFIFVTIMRQPIIGHIININDCNISGDKKFIANFKNLTNHDSCGELIFKYEIINTPQVLCNTSVSENWKNNQKTNEQLLKAIVEDYEKDDLEWISDSF
jgi:hypothetical protein